MSTNEQQVVREKYYNEATRYMNNANDFLKKAKKEGKFYHDPKYVKIACGTAYSGLLVALDGFFVLRGLHSNGKKVRKSIEYYQSAITKIDRKMLDNLNVAYKILHLSGYYDGIESVSVIKEGFDLAYKLIEKIKPETVNLN
jgi:hypothetical protein